ncbi:MAG: hypothetical protein ABI770_09720 [Sphingomicrobium sp.]
MTELRQLSGKARSVAITLVRIGLSGDCATAVAGAVAGAQASFQITMASEIERVSSGAWMTALSATGSANIFFATSSTTWQLSDVPSGETAAAGLSDESSDANVWG